MQLHALKHLAEAIEELSRCEKTIPLGERELFRAVRNLTAVLREAEDA